MNDLTFIETQFPISKISKESYKERMANYSQTLTGLGKWWGRKPLVLVRAAVLGLLMPASDDPERDREIFLALMTMDDEGLWARKTAAGKSLNASEVHRILTDDPHQARVEARIDRFLPRLPHVTHDLKSSLQLFMTEQGANKYKWKPKLEPREKEELERFAFESLYYDEKLDYCARPEQIAGPSVAAWQKINAHLKTNASSLPELVRELGQRRFGRAPRVGDAFCGGGSIPFEAARLGCDVYASDLNPVAALLTWAALHIIGGGESVAAEIRQAQETIYQKVDQQMTEWGIEHNAAGHRADAYLYCMEVLDPESHWRVPLAPSWVIGEKTKTVAILEPVPAEKRYRILIKMNASAAEMAAAKQGTVRKGYVVHPMNPNPVPMSLVRRENKDGLRLWENEDLAPRPDDVFQERLYCIRYVEPYYYSKLEAAEWTEDEAKKLPDFAQRVAHGELIRSERRYYTEPQAEDLQREARVLELLRERFADWQAQGFIPSKKIEPGYNTTQPIRERGWTHWQHLFNPRQLLVNGLFAQLSGIFDNPAIASGLLLAVARCTDWNSKLSRWWTDAGHEKIVQTFSNQALNTLSNYGNRGLLALGDSWFLKLDNGAVTTQIDQILTRSALEIDHSADVWITDPPYADAVNYHELSEYFLAWIANRLRSVHPDWLSDSRRSLAIRGDEESFRQAMVAAYANLCKQMPDNGLQIVMFTHQDVDVWADLSVVLWAAGLRVTAAWTIATETSFGKGINYVQGTVLLVLRKNISEEIAFLSELAPRIEEEVRRQVESMERIEDKEEPNFSDTDYQLAAYAAALRVLTAYKQIEDLDVERELSRARGKGQPGALTQVIENARELAAAIRLPEGLDKSVWRDLAATERLYLRGLDFESKGELRAGAYQELARSYGVRDYADLLASARANEARVKTAAELGERGLGAEGFGGTLLRRILYALHHAQLDDSAQVGLNILRTEIKDYWKQRTLALALLRFLARFEHSLPERLAESRMAYMLAGLVQNDAG